jgi:hypothetical protein
MGMPKWFAAMLYLLVFSCLMMNLGCQHAWTQSEPEIVELTVIDRNAFSNRNDKSAHFMVISERADLIAQYRKMHAKSLTPLGVPSIDFSKKRVLLAFLGQRSTVGYKIDFKSSTSLTKKTLVVTVTFKEPAPGVSLAQVVTSPYAVATVQRDGYRKVKFVDPAGKELALVKVK